MEIPTTYWAAETLLHRAKNIADGKPIGNNTRVVASTTGDRIGIQYHATIIAEFDRNGATIATDGWRTRTTAARLQPIFRNAGYNLSSRHGEWYVTHNVTGTETPFLEGMRIQRIGFGKTPEEYTLVYPSPGELAAETLRREIRDGQRRSINNWVRSLTQDTVSNALDDPGCPTCKVGVAQAAHLEAHLEERWLTRSILVAAYHRRGYVHPMVMVNLAKDDYQSADTPKVIRRYLIEYILDYT